MYVLCENVYVMCECDEYVWESGKYVKLINSLTRRPADVIKYGDS